VENVEESGGSNRSVSSWEHTADTSASMIEAALSGSEQRMHEAYVKFCHRYFVTIRRWCARHFSDNPDAADEAAAQLMLDIYDKLKRYKPRPDKTFRSWLSVVTRNECADLRRRASQRRKHVGELTNELEIPDSEDNIILELLVDSERRRLLKDLLNKAADKISEKERGILEGYLAERTPQEIADLHQTSLGAVYTTMSRIRSRLGDTITQLLVQHPGLELEDLMNPL
jgi:RNA polymerase sigma factor (sigma-70 family)